MYVITSVITSLEPVCDGCHVETCSKLKFEVLFSLYGRVKELAVMKGQVAPQLVGIPEM